MQPRVIYTNADIGNPNHVVEPSTSYLQMTDRLQSISTVNRNVEYLLFVFEYNMYSLNVLTFPTKNYESELESVLSFKKCLVTINLKF